MSALAIGLLAAGALFAAIGVSGCNEHGETQGLIVGLMLFAACVSGIAALVLP